MKLKFIFVVAAVLLNSFGLALFSVLSVVVLNTTTGEKDERNPLISTQIIRILNETQTPATLFLGGLWMHDHQAETLELSGNPLFELGNHSWSHADFSAISKYEMEQEILLAQQIMYDLLGYETNLFRLPYGTYTDEALDAINDQGLYIIQWDNVNGDPDPNIDAKEMTAWVLQQAQPGSIIIMHANGRGWHTAEALPGIIEALRRQGFTLVTISELLKLQPYK